MDAIKVRSSAAFFCIIQASAVSVKNISPNCQNDTSLQNSNPLPTSLIYLLLRQQCNVKVLDINFHYHGQFDCSIDLPHTKNNTRFINHKQIKIMKTAFWNVSSSTYFPCLTLLYSSSLLRLLKFTRSTRINMQPHSNMQ